MAKCQSCGKSPQFGQNRPFSLKATKRRFSANIQNATVYEGGHRRRVKLCTRCLRTMAKNA
jgi:large subunit ribosomal protein L28